MIKDTDIPITNITIYRLDIYRLLTLLLADKQIANNAVFKDLGNDNFDNEVNRLLILVAAITRQLLDNTDNKLKDRKCGDFWHNYPIENNPAELKLHQACSMIIHATDIVIKPLEYYYSEEGKQVNINKEGPELYFQNKVTVRGKKKERADIDLRKFAQHCIELSNEIIKGD